MLNEEEPPNIALSEFQSKFSEVIRKAKSKHQFNILKSFLAHWSGVLNKKSLIRITEKVVSQINLARNFIVEKRFLPHITILLLGLIVALCNVLVAQGANDLYNLIPANPGSQVAIAKSLDAYTDLISNDAQAVEKIITTSDDASSNFDLGTKITTTEITDRSVPASEQPSGPRKKTISYSVNPGETLSGLSMKFNVKVASIKYVNNLTNIDLIKPGDKIKIPPEGYEPTAKEIAAQKKKNTSVSSSTSGLKKIISNVLPGRKNNGYPYGWCTYYVATRRAVPTGFGNGGAWLSSAKRFGWSTGSTPVSGAIVVTRESWLGHVGYVESVSGNSFTISEMNYKGWGVTSSRTMSVGDGVIKGFIY
ncbi:MAG: CHAP domain protein [Candidatus Berkelbacteria bacterium Athens1014_28]|uniref:CHAP domain protein n=1 Tax=Candidatus Berkelbacteria bacterium Athens1014_28 TaxID=2017145 RepID=A0A554LN56_9BACT|nr:MAG: CHAP domain protein [Candidatus Berkelbacteria bacterium Athens1014_28]